MEGFVAGVLTSFFVACVIAILWLVAEERRYARLDRAVRADLPSAMLVRRRRGRS